MFKHPKIAAGRTVFLEHASRVLRDNPLGDPSTRRLGVWLPPQYDAAGTRAAGRRFPVLFYFAAYGSSGPARLGWRAFEETIAERAARLVHERRMAPAILVFPDCFTRLGGSQYVNSSAIGNYADYLTRELVPFVDREFRTLAAREHRGCLGHSSGGYGALLHGMRYPRTWGAVADHSGDCYFDFSYLPDWPATLDTLAAHAPALRAAGPIDVRRRERGAETGCDDGRVARFLAAFQALHRPSSADLHALMNLCMAATYDPDPAAPLGFRLPFNLETGERLEARWSRWRRHDPIHLVGRHAAALASLRGLYLDCGWRDEYRLHYGARILSKRLAEAGVAHRYEEFSGGHSGVDYRLDISLPYLVRCLGS